MISEILQTIHKQFEVGYQSAEDVGLQYASKEFHHIIIAGMGGSVLAGEILINLSTEIQNTLPITIHRDYGMPIAPLREKALVVVSSYSGDTQEALDAYNTAMRMKLPVVAISSGGQLVKKVESDTVPLALIQDGTLPPRKSIGYQLGALLRVLENINIIPSQKQSLLSLKQNIKKNYHKEQTKGRELAKHIQNSTPLIFSSAKYSSVAYIMQTLINESANSPAFSGVFPAINHNLLMSYDKMPFRQFYTIIIQGDDEDPRIQKRQEVTAQTIQENKGIVSMLPLQGNNMYSKIFDGIMIGNWTAAYLAKQKQVDPISIPILAKFKNQVD